MASILVNLHYKIQVELNEIKNYAKTLPSENEQKLKKLNEVLQK